MRAGPACKSHPKVKFSLEEDFRLRVLVMQYGDENWNFISSLMKDRNPRQCRERWTKYLSPLNRYEPFTQEEDKFLLLLVQQYGKKWVKISKYFQNRTDVSIKNRWLVLQRQKHRQDILSKNNASNTQESPILLPISPFSSIDEDIHSNENIHFLPNDFYDDLLSPNPVHSIDLNF